MEKYSVLMSVYKKVDAKDLKQSIDSMLAQTVPPEQMIVVLDGPVNEGVKSLLDSLQTKRSELFTLVPLQENHGLAYALNRGLSQCRNEFVARMDSDDYSLPERCERQLAFFKEHPEYVLLGTSTRNFVGDISNIISYVKNRPLSYEEICDEIHRFCPFCHPSVMFKKSVVEKMGGYDDEMTRSQDYELFSRLIWKGYKVANLPDALLLFRADEGFSERTRSRESCECRIKIQKRLLERKQCSLYDYLYIWAAMKATAILPIGLYNSMYMWIKKRG